MPVCVDQIQYFRVGSFRNPLIQNEKVLICQIHAKKGIRNGIAAVQKRGIRTIFRPDYVVAIVEFLRTDAFETIVGILYVE